MYSLLPFKFLPRDDKALVVNFVGDYRIITSADFSALLMGSIQEGSDLYNDLQGLQIISSGDPAADIEILSTRYRTKKAYLNDFTTLHMVVTTLRCNQQCRYCHATAKKEDDERSQYDMTIETAERTAEMIMMSPSPVIKVEFQGGDSSLNMPVVRAIVNRVEAINKELKKVVEFVICTNLLNVDSEMLDYWRAHKFSISISLDGNSQINLLSTFFFNSIPLN